MHETVEFLEAENKKVEIDQQERRRKFFEEFLYGEEYYIPNKYLLTSEKLEHWQWLEEYFRFFLEFSIPFLMV